MQPPQPQGKPKIDRVGWIAILLLVGALFLYMYQSGKNAEEERKRRAEEEKNNPPALVEGGGSETGSGKEGSPDGTGTGTGTGTSPAGEGSAEAAPEELAVLKSGNVEFELSTAGGGIKVARILDHPLTVEDETPVTLNTLGKAPIGSLATSETIPLIDHFKVVEKTATSVTMETTRPDGLMVRKVFRVPAFPTEEEQINPGYLEMELYLENHGQQPIALGDQYLYVGSTFPMDPVRFAVPPAFVYNEDGDSEQIKQTYFKKGWIRKARPRFEESIDEPLWAGTMNRFFLTLVSPEDNRATKVWARRYEESIPYVPDSGDRAAGRTAEDLPEAEKDWVIHGGIHLAEKTLPAQSKLDEPLRYQLYAGAKEYSLLKKSSTDQDDYQRQDGMFYGTWIFTIFDPISVLLQKIIDFFYGLVSDIGFVQKIGAWGVAIILMTLVVRALMWPLHAKSSRSMKKMSKLSEPMKELREKYEDDPQKMQTETMKLYRRYGVNPVAGCLPVLFQLPIFMGLFGMLRSAAELRGEHFLWADDLSQPDTMFHLFGFPINPLPLLMTVTMGIQFMVAPKSGDKNQRIIFLLMPVFFLVMCYGYASALALYWTTSNIFTIFQTWFMRFQPEPELVDKEVEAKKIAAAEKRGKRAKGRRTGG